MWSGGVVAWWGLDLGAVVAFEPIGESVEAGEEDAFGNISLIEFVADFPFEFGGDDDAACDFGVLVEPLVEGEGGVGGDGEKGVLVDDAVVDGRRLEEEDEVVIGTPGHIGEAGDDLAEEVDGVDIGAFAVEGIPEDIGKNFVGLPVIGGPDDAVEVELLDVGGGEMQGDEGGIGPIEEAGGEAVVLSDGHPMPEGFPLHDPTMGIFPEVAKEVFLKAGEVTPESGKGGFKGVGGVGKPAVGAVGAVPGDVGVPGIGKEGILEVVPGGYPGFLHVGGGWWEGGNVLRY